MIYKSSYSQLSPAEDQRFLALCVQTIADKLAWGEGRQWTNGNFEKLSEIIYLETKVSISSSTLKRLFGKSKTYKNFYNPQLATKNALAAFVGYTDWDDFTNQNRKPFTENAIDEDALLVPKTRTIIKKWLVVVVFLSVPLIFLIINFNDRVKHLPTLSTNIQAGFAPLQTTFTIHNSLSILDTLTIDFGDGTQQLLTQEINTIKHNYNRSGVYISHLIVNRKVFAQTTIQVNTAGWETEILHNQIYNVKSDVKRDKNLFYAPSNLSAVGINTDSIYWTINRNIRDYNVSGDDFTIEAGVLNGKKDGGISCYDFNMDVYGINENIKIEFLDPNCIVWVDFIISDVKVDGKETDLSTLGIDLSTWRLIRLEVKNKVASLFVDNKQVYTSPTYNTPIGSIKGLMLGFKGSGKVDYIKLFNPSERLVYEETFD